ncbi:NAD(P)/FAD-dependent oxidoreductase [Methanobrevibacter sp.]|uniref:geranylgeranyl reductase family protein n=1 Tax=Methanobrevibacter sp. TaxID=66852 RepID=UPI0025F2E068|nr:NAD(P)/FAD-dependent oxidoreductase [Methanobrevibacter sp.]MBQ6511464.1 NAD(P)/FAD-dependent oxidoreductase [Methanobrevibacter sp.]
MNFDYDVCVVGAGPVGSTISYYLSLKGLSVVLLDKKTKIGFPLQCAGILSYHIDEFNELPEDIILNKVKGAFLHSPNHILNVKKDSDVAYIIDRVAYDQFLLNRATGSGVKLITQKAVDFNIDEGLTTLQNNEKIKSKVIVGCDGYNSDLSKYIGNDQDNYPASQMLVKISANDIYEYRKDSENISDYVDACLLEEALPGFLWLIPVGEDLYRAGLFSKDSHKRQADILMDYLNKNNLKFEIIEKYKGFIPIFNKNNKLAKSRAVLIGDAAGQVKPTSGGGLMIAFDACRFASEYIVQAIEKNDFSILEKYHEEFLDKYQKEFSYQIKVQKTLQMLTNDDLDYLYMKLKENDGEKLISEYGDMDTQSVLIKESVKRGLVFKVIPSFLFKKVGKIFGF